MDSVLYYRQPFKRGVARPSTKLVAEKFLIFDLGILNEGSCIDSLKSKILAYSDVLMKNATSCKEHYLWTMTLKAEF